MFSPQSVPRALVEESLALAQHAPSYSDIQPWHMVFAPGPPRNDLVAAVLSEVQRGQSKIPPLPESFPLALWIDLVVPKRRQLEIYLNMAQWGHSGDFGARRAFGKSAGIFLLIRGRPAGSSTARSGPTRRAPPGEGLSPLAATYVGRAAAVTDIDRCVRTAQ
jgi:nitroreductase